MALSDADVQKQVMNRFNLQNDTKQPFLTLYAAFCFVTPLKNVAICCYCSWKCVWHWESCSRLAFQISANINWKTSFSDFLASVFVCKNASYITVSSHFEASDMWKIWLRWWRVTFPNDHMMNTCQQGLMRNLSGHSVSGKSQKSLKPSLKSRHVKLQESTLHII